MDKAPKNFKEYLAYEVLTCPMCFSNSEWVVDINKKPLGKLIIRNGEFGTFLACTNFPLCQYAHSHFMTTQTK